MVSIGPNYERLAMKNRKFCIKFKRSGVDATFGDEVYATTFEEAHEVAQVLYGTTAKVDGQLCADVPADGSEPKYYDNNGTEISKEEWLALK